MVVSSTDSSSIESGTQSSPQENVILIAVTGMTGTGKSTFINLVSGAKFNVGSHDGLLSCTSDITCSHIFELFGRHIVLIDTPGFDDVTKSDTDVLKMIASHLSATCIAGTTLGGVIYMHRIDVPDTRMGGTSPRNFSMFRKLCGEDVLRNVLLVTTMWSKDDSEQNEIREKQLVTLEQPILEKGAQMARYDNTLESAQAIIRRLVRNRSEPSYIQVQLELFGNKKDIGETGAGEGLTRELKAVIKKHKDELDDIRGEMADILAQKDVQTAKELEEARKEIEDKTEEFRKASDKLTKYAEQIKRMQEEIEELKSRRSSSCTIIELTPSETCTCYRLEGNGETLIR